MSQNRKRTEEFLFMELSGLNFSRMRESVGNTPFKSGLVDNVRQWDNLTSELCSRSEVPSLTSDDNRRQLINLLYDLFTDRKSLNPKHNYCLEIMYSRSDSKKQSTQIKTSRNIQAVLLNLFDNSPERQFK